ncbi:hypothetical protein [uncultured Rikenella sp.]|uniref:hypothetical protein n=1 Tax=uncultured Rikenella sp. TaxID=368003 RepID=UPI0025E7303B|nr:hypothetical protein [uncultured Rikenella sp.]
MNDINNIREAVRRLAQGGRRTTSLICTVDAVDRAARTVDCTPIDESAPLLGVNLQANQESRLGLVAFPKVGSFVVVGFVAEGSAGVVLLTDEVESIEMTISEQSARITADENSVCIRMGNDTCAELTSEGITLNGGGFGGTIKAEQLTARLNAIENDLNQLKKIFAEWTPSPQDGGATLFVRSVIWSTSPLRLTQRTDYENEKVKHG